MINCNICNQDFQPGPIALLDYPGKKIITDAHGTQESEEDIRINVCDTCRLKVDRWLKNAIEQQKRMERHAQN